MEVLGIEKLMSNMLLIGCLDHLAPIITKEGLKNHSFTYLN